MSVKKILVAIDGSAHAKKAVGVASDMAQRYDAEVVLLHVLLSGKLPEALTRMVEAEHLADDAPSAPKHVVNVPRWMTALTAGGEDTKERRQVMAVGQRIVEQAELVIREKGVTGVRTLVEEGNAANQILKCAADEHPDFIVMGSRGLGTIDRLLQGSVSQKVTQLATCTCISVR